MIVKQEYGKWHSLPKEKPKNEIDNILSGLSPEELAAFNELIKSEDLDQFKDVVDTVNELDYDPATGPPIPIREWLESDYHLGDTRKAIFPILKKDIIEIFEGGYNEIILGGSTRWGKSYITTVCLVRIIYELLCYKSPQEALGLGPGEPMYILPISIKKETAHRIAFEGIGKKLELAPFFRGKFEKTLDEIRFPGKNITVLAGGSSKTPGGIGLAVIAACADELNFFSQGGSTAELASGKHYDRAQMVYNSIGRRIKAGFRNTPIQGKIFLISSKKGTEDFTERRIKEAVAEKEENVFVREYSIVDIKPENYVNQKWHRCIVGSKEGRARVLDDHEVPPPDAVVVKFPNDFLSEFRRDPEGSLRDLMGVCLNVTKPFFGEQKAIDDMMQASKPSIFKNNEWDTSTNLEIPWNKFMTVNARNEPIPLCCPHAMRHVGLDMSRNLCNTGFVCGHKAHDVEVERINEKGEKVIEIAPVIHIDGILKIVPPPGAEVDHEAVRELIYRLTEGGLPIRSVSLDQWCFTPNEQLLKNKGYKVKQISVVRNIAPYLALKTLLAERRIESPIHRDLKKELYEVELTDSGKVEPPQHGFRDLSDSLCQTISYLLEYGKSTRPIMPQKGGGQNSAYNQQVGNATYIGNGDFRWADEMPPDKTSGNDGLPSWIII